MTTTRTHQCNFCRDTIKPEDGIGLTWIVGETLEVMPMHGVENHLCRRCGKALEPILSRLFNPKK